MDKTKAAISSFMSKSGHHDTTVHESVNPAVQHETVRPQQHEEVITAVDKEVHQDHYHHTVQPVKDQEILAEQHHHNIGQAEHRQFDHRDESKVKERLALEAAKFKNESRRVETEHTQSHAPVVQGEHVHHHVHETYQPVIHKETIEPHVVHTTIPIHETHHHEAKHHATSTLPAVSLSEFKQHGGTHTGGQHEHHKFDGCPDVEGGAHSHNKGLTNITGTGAGASRTRTGRRGSNSSSSSSDREGTRGPHKSKVANVLDPRVDSDGDHRGATNNSRTGATGGYGAGTTGTSTSTGNYGATPGTGAGNYSHTPGTTGGSAAGAALGSRGVGHETTPRTSTASGTSGVGHHNSTTGKEEKPSLLTKVMDKVNSSRS